MLKKNKVFEWSVSANNSYEKLKNILSSPPVLVIADFRKEFILFTDASNVAVSAVLTQLDDHDIYRPISFMSHKLNHAQSNYSTIEKETFALVLAVRTYRIYLSGRVIVYTDHEPLVQLRKLTPLNNRLLKWCLELAAFNLVVKHIQGIKNCFADFLSRPAINVCKAVVGCKLPSDQRMK
jgi:hypothetical protein